MEMNEYQVLAARTINPELSRAGQVLHALHGMSAEVGEIHGIYQKSYQGHEFSQDQLQKEVGDVLWMIAEFCTAKGWNLSDVAEMNIEKLRKRYPDGFSAEKSVNRAE